MPDILLRGFWGLKPGPHAGKAHNLVTGLSPQDFLAISETDFLQSKANFKVLILPGAGI